MSSALKCPVCQSALREIDREGVSIDVCPQCRGVWLDRGELEKLSGLMAGAGFAEPSRAMAKRDDDGYSRRRRDDDEDDDDHDRSRSRERHDRDSDKGYKKKQGLTRFLDFFD